MVLRVDYVVPAHKHPISDVNGLPLVLTDLQTQIDVLEAESASGATNLTVSRDATAVTVLSDTGADAVIAAADTNAGVMTAADRAKLTGIATGATANATDAQLRDRATHTGAQSIATVTGLQPALDGKAATAHTHVIADTTGLQGALDNKAASAHSHAIGDLPVATSGTSSATQVVRADDSRLSNARTPTAHVHAIADLPVAASGVSSATQVVRADDARLSGGGASPASETVAGVAEIATQAEVTTGTDDARFVTPLKLQTRIAGLGGGASAASETVAGIAEIATQAEADTGTDDARFVTPLKLKSRLDTKAPLSHSHLIADLPVATSGTSNATQVVRADDTRLSNARTPTTHSHVVADTTGLQTALDGKAAASHSHLIADLPVATSGTSNTTQVVRADDARLSNARAPTAHSHLIADLPVASSGASSATQVVRADDSRLSDTRTPSAHSHAIADLPVAPSGTSNTTQVVRADDARLSNARTPSTHTHVIADTTGLQTALDGKASLAASNTFTASQNIYAGAGTASAEFKTDGVVSNFSYSGFNLNTKVANSSDTIYNESATSRGWSVAAYSDNYTTAANRNALGFDYWNGSAWTSALTAFPSGLAKAVLIAQAKTKITAAGATTLTGLVSIVFANATAGSQTLTLPSAALWGAAHTARLLIRRIDATANTVTVARAGSDTINGGTASLTIAANAKLELIVDGTTAWFSVP